MTVGRWLTDRFLEWQNAQGDIRTVAEFAEYLSDNSKHVVITRPSISLWLNDKRKPTGVYAEVLAEKLGPRLYDLLGRARPDQKLAYISSVWDKISPRCVDRVIDMINADLDT